MPLQHRELCKRSVEIYYAIPYYIITITVTVTIIISITVTVTVTITTTIAITITTTILLLYHTILHYSLLCCIVQCYILLTTLTLAD